MSARWASTRSSNCPNETTYEEREGFWRFRTACYRECRGEFPHMRAAYYERNGIAQDVLQVGEIDTPRPGPGEVRVKLVASGVNPSDVKSRQGTTRKIAYPRVIP